MTKTGFPWKRNSPTSGLRLSSQASLVGAIRPGDADRVTPFFVLTAVTAVVASPPGRSTKSTRSGLKRKTLRMLPPGSPPSLPFSGAM